MSKVQIRLTKNWKNGDTDWPEGQILNVDDTASKSIIDGGFAELYTPETGDIVEVSPVAGEKANSGVSPEEVKEIMNEIMAKHSSFKDDKDEKDEFSKTGGFKSLGHFTSEVYKSTNGRQTEQMKNWTNHLKATGLSEGVAPDGGFAVPTIYSNTLMRNTTESSILLDKTMRIPMQTNAIDIPTILESSRASSIYGGIIVYRPDEGGSITASKPKFSKVGLKLNKMAAMGYASTELLEDSPMSMEPLLFSMFSDALAFQVDEDIINGTGAGQALGILNAPALISVAIETGQAANTIETKNILNMWSRMMSRSQGSAIWLANNDAFVQLATLSLPVGTGGSSAGLLQMSTNGVTGTPIMSLLGRPLYLTEHCQTVGTTGDLLCVDPKQYLVGEKNGGSIRSATSIHLKFDQDEVAFRFILRMDGQPWLQTPLTPKHSPNTLSSFVSLETRA